MKLKSIHKCWKLLPVGEKSIKQYVYSEDGQRPRFTENPENPIAEISRFIESNQSFSLLLMPPCSLESIKFANENFQKVIIVDYNEERLGIFNEETEGIYSTFLIKEENDLRESLSFYVNELSFGNVTSFIPSRYSRLDHRLRCLLKEDLLRIQQEFCSFAANRSLKSWHKTLNAVENIKNIHESILNIPNIQGRDVVIVGAGPSLDDTVSKLQSKKSFFYIVATDGSLKTLLKNNIEPDFIVSCEDTVMSWQFFSGYIDLLKNVPLFTPYNANHYLLKNYKGPICMTRDRDFEEWAEGILETLPEVNSGRCVGHFAYNLAIALGAGRIIMTGFDLAFKGELFHPKDMAVPYFHEMDLPVPVTVMSIGGVEIRTDLSMQTYLKDFEYMIEKSQIQVIDATEGGALISGTDIIGIDEISGLRQKQSLNLSLEQVSTLKNFNEKRMYDRSFFEQLAYCFTSYLVQNSKQVKESDKSEDRNMAYSILESLLLTQEASCETNVAILLPESYSKKESWFIWALENGLKLLEQEPLSNLLQKVKMSGVSLLYCVNGEVPPDLMALTGIKCSDIKTCKDKNKYERSLWIKNYSIMTSPALLQFWKDTVPSQNQVFQNSSIKNVEKVGNGN